MDAISVAHVAPDALLVLSGDGDNKSVSVFHDSIYSQSVIDFPVSRYSVAMQGGTASTFYLAVARPPHDSASTSGTSAVEHWNLHGQLLSTIELPGSILALSQTNNGIAYVMLNIHAQTEAVGVRLSDGKSVGFVALSDDDPSLDQCIVAGQPYLLTSAKATHRVRLINAKSGFSIDTSMFATQARCFSNGSAIVGIQSGTFGTDIAVLRLSMTRQRTDTIVAPADTVQLVPAEDGRLFLLRRLGSSSNIQILTRSEVADVAR